MNMNCDKELAPIAFFSYNRRNHTESAINSLLDNELASETELFVFSDGAKTKKDEEKVNDVREYLKTVTGFKKIHYVFRKENYGMKKNIIDGISEIVDSFGRVIVVEDDIIVTKRFLEYMNKALDQYRDEKRVMAISSYTSSIDKTKLEDFYFLPWFNCWGWGTWKDRWNLFNDDADLLVSNTSKKEIKYININGSFQGMWNQVLANQSGMLKSWAIFFYVAICKNNGLVLHSKDGFSSNIGADGSGVSGAQNDKLINVRLDEYNEEIELPRIIERSKTAEKAYERYYRNNFGWRGDLKRRFSYLLKNGPKKTIIRIVEVLNEKSDR